MSGEGEDVLEVMALITGLIGNRKVANTARNVESLRVFPWHIL